MAQENITLTLPSGVEAVIKPYISHKLSRKINVLLLKDKKFNEKSSAEGLSEEFSLSGEQALDYSDLLVKGLLVSLDGSFDNLEERVDELPQKDFDALFKKAAQVRDDCNKKISPKS